VAESLDIYATPLTCNPDAWGNDTLDP
jgi:hypothetical protein